MRHSRIIGVAGAFLSGNGPTGPAPSCRNGDRNSGRRTKTAPTREKTQTTPNSAAYAATSIAPASIPTETHAAQALPRTPKATIEQIIAKQAVSPNKRRIVYWGISTASVSSGEKNTAITETPAIVASRLSRNKG